MEYQTMQKKIIALAIAALASSAAMAQSNVTIYGVVDAYAGAVTAKQNAGTADVKYSGINSNGLSTSRIGFKGVEDLGNGLKALFTLEYTLGIDNNATIGAAGLSGSGSLARQQFVGLTGGFGTVVAGRLETPWSNHGVKYNPLGGAMFNPLDMVNTANGQTASSDRTDSTIAYVTPTMGGFVGKIALASIDELSGGTTVANDKNAKARAWVVSADYDQGPMSIGAVYRAVGNNDTAVPTAGATTYSCPANTPTVAYAVSGINCVGTSIGANPIAGAVVSVTPATATVAATTYAAPVKSGRTEWSLAGSYDLGVAKLGALYQHLNLKSDAETGLRSYAVYGVVPFGASALIAEFADSKGKNAAGGKLGAKAYTLAATHSLSKRTTAYAGYTKVDGKTNETGVALNTSAGNLTAGTDKAIDGFVLGMRHTF
jgi:predicted porin